MNITRILTLIICFLVVNQYSSFAQIIAPIGNPAKASSQLVFYYDDSGSNEDGDDSVIQVTNTNDTTGVWVHVQIFRSFDPTNGDPGEIDDNMTNPIICDERNFVDFFTPNDTHIYDFDLVNFPKNIGENQTTPGESTSIDVNTTVGFAIVTPVVSEADLSAIAFKHMIGQSLNDDEDLAMNAMGRDAFDFTTGELVTDGTVLDGVNNGYIVIQPEELLFMFAGDEDDADGQIDPIGIVFADSYGDPGLLGYQVLPGSATWTSFIFDFKEDPTSCGTREVACFLNVGLNDSLEQDESELNEGDILLCEGSTTPEYPDTSIEFDEFGWGRIFISGLGDFENHLGVLKNDDVDSADWMYTRGDRTEIEPEPEDEVCDDDIDNDEDGFTDCEDTDCATDESCETGEEECADEMDNDEDGDTDCADLGCDGFAGCEFGEEVSCDDGIDNDADGAVDGDDTDCQAADTGGTGGDGDGGGCVVTGTVSTTSSVVNFLVLMLPFIGVFGIRRFRNKVLGR